MTTDQYSLNAYGLGTLSAETKEMLSCQFRDHLHNYSDQKEVFAVIYDGSDESDPFNYSLCPLDMESYQTGGYVWVYFTAGELALCLKL